MTSISFEELSKYFDMKLEDACNEIKLSSTSMKKLCREFNIQRCVVQLNILSHFSDGHIGN
jgi:hypothetical protein